VELKDKVAVITGGGQGLGEGVCRRFAAEGATVVVVDLKGGLAESVAKDIGGLGLQADVGVEKEIRGVVDTATQEFGRVDVFYSNAGIGGNDDVFIDDAVWQRNWQVHVMAHVYAARAVLPQMLERGDGYLLATASGNGLTSQPWSMTYSVTKHAAVAASEWLALTYRPRGVKVSCVCPYGMATPMLLDQPKDSANSKFGIESLMPVEDVAEVIVQGMREEKFLILPHPEVLEHLRFKVSDYDRWLRGMGRLRERIDASSSS
jgi:NAD(P)-dependent dehydrogenase (short-subunit alcohol dehydrogenase family)